MEKKNRKPIKIIKMALAEPKKQEFAYSYTPLESFEGIVSEKGKHDGAM